MRIGMDLLWVRPQICGGTEAVVRNLINGFGRYDGENEYVLFVGQDVAVTFYEYERYANIKVCVCKTESLKRLKRIAWENLKLDKIARNEKIDLMFVPVYSKPNSKPVDRGGIPYVTVIHDLQALHYPEYFSKLKRIFSKRSWKKACKESVCVITGSEYCKEDIIKYYPFVKDKIKVIYDPVSVTDDIGENQKDKVFKELSKKYGVSENGFFYTVSSMLPHKNLDTLLRLMKILKETTEYADLKLIVSGVGGNKEEFISKVGEYDIADRVVDAGFVSDVERDVLYEKCLLFLFPSEFEGFGLPPIEAMMKGARVVASNHPCIEEVTLKKATYVESVKDEKEWKQALTGALTKEKCRTRFQNYEIETVSKAYTETFGQCKRK